MQYRRRIPRRTFLRGLGVSLGLPFLDAMLSSCSEMDAQGDAAAPRQARSTTVRVRPVSGPRRIVYFYVPNGFIPAQFTPAQEGPLGQLPSALAPLAPHRDQVTVLSGVDNPLWERSAFHTCSTVGLLTGHSVLKNRLWASTSIDQIAAAHIGDQTPIRSLELGTVGAHQHISQCDGSWSCVYGDHLSWASATRPMPKATDPVMVFRRLFAVPGEGRSFTDEQRRRRSLLDYVAGASADLRARLGASDRLRVDEYLEAVREVERRVLRFSAQPPESDVVPDASASSLEARFDVMIDLVALALRADLTRVVTLMHGFALYDEPYTFLGVPANFGGHHGVSHHGGDPRRIEAQTAIGAWEMRRFARLLERLSVPEGGGTVLDNTAVLFMSDLRDGEQHVLLDLPLIVAGRGGGALRPGGRHVRYAQALLPDLHISLLATLGLDLSSFGDMGTSRLPGLLV